MKLETFAQLVDTAYSTYFYHSRKSFEVHGPFCCKFFSFVAFPWMNEFWVKSTNFNSCWPHEWRSQEFLCLLLLGLIRYNWMFFSNLINTSYTSLSSYWLGKSNLAWIPHDVWKSLKNVNFQGQFTKLFKRKVNIFQSYFFRPKLSRVSSVSSVVRKSLSKL